MTEKAESYKQILGLIDTRDLRDGLITLGINRPGAFYLVMSMVFLNMVGRSEAMVDEIERRKKAGEPLVKSLKDFMVFAGRIERLKALVEKQMNAAGFGFLVEGEGDGKSGGVDPGKSNVAGPCRIVGCHMGPVQKITSLN